MGINAFTTIRELKRQLKKNEISPREVLDFYIRRFEMFDDNIMVKLSSYKTIKN